MSYLIRPDRPLRDEVIRVGERQYAKAIDILRLREKGPHEAIHDARKCFKRLRGLFRLIRAAAPDFAARENARVRDIAATLSAVRDATALVEAMDHLIGSQATAGNHDTLFAIRARLAERRDRIASHETGLDDRIEAAITACEEGMAALDDVRVPGKSAKAASLVAKAVAKNYGHAVSALATATQSGDPEDWHDLRKRIKYHRMHMQLLSPLWPGEMALRADTADLAGEALGDDNDLANLEALIATEPETIGSEPEIAILRACMAARSKDLHDEIRHIVRNLLRDDKRVLESRITALWRDAAG